MILALMVPADYRAAPVLVRFSSFAKEPLDHNGFNVSSPIDGDFVGEVKRVDRMLESFAAHGGVTLRLRP